MWRIIIIIYIRVIIFAAHHMTKFAPTATKCVKANRDPSRYQSMTALNPAANATHLQPPQGDNIAIVI